MKNRIRDLRKKLGLTQQDIANRLGLKRQTITAYEIGTIAPSPRTLTDICRLFDVNEEWLRTGNGEMFIEKPNGVLEVLFQKYNVSPDARVLVEEFLRLKPESQQVFAEYAKKVAERFRNGEESHDGQEEDSGLYDM